MGKVRGVSRIGTVIRVLQGKIRRLHQKEVFREGDDMIQLLFYEANSVCGMENGLEGAGLGEARPRRRSWLRVCGGCGDNGRGWLHSRHSRSSYSHVSFVNDE